MAGRIAVQSDDFDAATELAALTNGRCDIGAVVSFIGLCRDEGGRLAALELEHYPAMAEKKIRAIVDEASARWPLLGVTVIHRYGKIDPGGQIVLVLVTSSHRRASFEAAEFLMDYLKTRAPFWKREHLKTGEAGEWVEARDIDDEAMARWYK